MSDREDTHFLKTWPNFLDAIYLGRKPFEIRKNDRDFKVGDHLFLEEYCPDRKEYSGAKCCAEITYITDWEQKPNTVVMGIRLYHREYPKWPDRILELTPKV